MTDARPDPLDAAPATPSTASAAPDADAKARLRATLRADRRARAAATGPQDRDRSARALSRRVREHLADRAQGEPRAWRVAAFEALPTEVPTHVLLAELVADGCDVLVPVLRPDNDLDWRAWRPSPEPAATPGPPPSSSSRPQDPELLGLDAIAGCDLVLVPALAVDRGGRRLGQGGGSYDRALPRRRPGVPVIALVADPEFVDGPLPVAAHDEPVDGVVTPGGGHQPLPRS